MKSAVGAKPMRCSRHSNCTPSLSPCSNQPLQTISAAASLAQMAKNNRIKMQTPEVCPVCGDDVPRKAQACPQCGADHNSGWREEAENYEALDLPDEDFNYDEFVRREFGSSVKPAGMKMIWWITAILILIATVALYFLSAR